MKNILDELYNVLSQQYELYNNFLDVENRKHDAIIKDDIVELDKVVEEEQVFFLKSRGLESKRLKIAKELNMENMTLMDITRFVNDDEKPRFQDIHKKISMVLRDFKDKNTQCQDLTQIRLHRINMIINKLDSTGSYKKQYERDGQTGKIDVNRVNLVSKKI